MRGKPGSKFFKKAGKVVKYKSSWERLAMEMLEKDDSVESFEYEPFKIKYLKPTKRGNKAKIRNYIPDLIVTYRDGRKKLIEVKPLWQVDMKINKSKFFWAKKKCLREGWEFEIWTQRELKI